MYAIELLYTNTASPRVYCTHIAAIQSSWASVFFVYGTGTKGGGVHPLPVDASIMHFLFVGTIQTGEGGVSIAKLILCDAIP